MLAGKRILLIIGGGIAAYKVLELVRLYTRAGALVIPVLTKAGSEFVTPLSVSALAGRRVYQDLFDLTDEAEMGHIQLSREADVIVVAPATADLLAKMAGGRADDLASTLLLATNKPVLVAPAMNVQMWHHRAVMRNVALLQQDGIVLVGPDYGDMACGEFGLGRMAEPNEILKASINLLSPPLEKAPLVGKHIIVTSGPTHEPIDPVRYIGNRSSGAQGTALACALRDLGAKVSFVSGPAHAPPPDGVCVIRVETALEMREAVQKALPADAAVFVAAVGDWRAAHILDKKIKKMHDTKEVSLELYENPDILADLSASDLRPPLVVGFAAETDNVIDNAIAKRKRKGCDWIVANDVSPQTRIMGGQENAVTLITDAGAETWPRMSKSDVAQKLALRIAEAIV